MQRDKRYFTELVLAKSGKRRFTQDSPVLPEVFCAYGASADKEQDLLLTPDWKKTPGELAAQLSLTMGEDGTEVSGKATESPPSRLDAAEIAHNQSVVAARLSFEDLICCLLPLSWWWQHALISIDGVDPVAACSDPTRRQTVRDELLAGLELEFALSADSGTGSAGGAPAATQRSSRHWIIRQELAWAARIFWTVQHANRGSLGRAGVDGSREQGKAIVSYLLDVLLPRIASLQEGSGLSTPGEPFLYSINRNRTIESTGIGSIVTIKADAAARTFAVTGKGVRWAIVDSGIDARHSAFRRIGPDGRPYADAFEGGPHGNRTRIKATYDFSDVRRGLSADQRRALKSGSGRLVDWEALESSLQLHVAHDPDGYRTPVDDHGTHVAGILAADWRPDPEAVDPLGPPPPAREPREAIRGLCPDIELYDLRVFRPDGTGDEFAVMSALQFVRSLNQRFDAQEIHGVNLSLSMHHDVANYACGQSPVCEECTRLVHNGVVVVAAAGNEGRSIQTTTQGHSEEGYRDVSIADPGNAEAVITVGATHRREPHTYGVSYFSSRGPTGDGRLKPDLVAPGEKIQSTVPGDRLARKDGTSQAAPHVSGAAALLMSRHRELIGEPARIKQVLMETATDLGRMRHFQGAGLVDVMRAIQRL